MQFKVIYLKYVQVDYANKIPDEERDRKTDRLQLCVWLNQFSVWSALLSSCGLLLIFSCSKADTQEEGVGSGAGEGGWGGNCKACGMQAN